MNIGDSISRYRILGQLGKGGMGVVYKAEDTRLNRPVALKFLPGDSLSEPDRQRFLNEARAAAMVQHPGICPVYDIEEDGGRVFIAMACLEGETLSKRIARGPLSIKDALSLAIQAANALEYAHEMGVVHRDIKSSNLMVDSGGHVSIMDFGLALMPDETRLTVTGSVMGTPAYMSPEQAQGHLVDRRTDIWSLGVVLFEMLAGNLPFRRGHSTAVIHAILFDPVPRLRESREDLPRDVTEALENVIGKALAKRPDDRWQTAREFGSELRRIESGETASNSVVPPNSVLATRTMVQDFSSPVTAHRSPRRRILILLFAAALLLVGGGLGISKYRASRIPRASEAAPAERQIAVLPFTVIGEAESTRTISDGLVEILTSALSDFERFQGQIVAVPSSEIRRRQIGSAEEARRVYGVNLAITGSAMPAGNKVEFTLSLVDTAKLRQIGSKSFVYDPANPLGARDQAVSVMVKLLDFNLDVRTNNAIKAGDTAAPGAYSSYLEGRGLLARYDLSGNVDKAIASFQRALAEDPKYALAYSGLAEAYLRKARATGDRQWAALAARNAERGVQLDPALGMTHSTLGLVYGSAGKENEAVAELRKAMELAPSNADAPRELAQIYTNLGRFSEAETLYIQAATSRPTDWYGHFLLGVFYFQREQYDQAEREIRKASDLAPNNDNALRSLAGVYTFEGRYRESIDLLKKSLQLRPIASAWASLGVAYYFEHRFADSVSATEAALAMDSSQYRWWGNLGIFCEWAPGQETKGPEALRHAIAMGRKLAEATPKDYQLRANLAEYEARLGEARNALREIESIPPASRSRFASRLAVAWELTGHRKEAIEVIRENLTTVASLTQIRNDPSLTDLWNDPAMQAAVRGVTR